MLGFLGPGVGVHQLDLAFPGGDVRREDLAFRPGVSPVGLLEATVVAVLPPIELPAVQAGLPVTPAPAVHAGPDLGLSANVQARSLLLPAPAIRTVDGPMAVQVKTDLAFMRGRAVQRRGIPASRLSEEQAAYWTKRLADSRRIGIRLIKLVAVFPDLELEDGRPVAYRQEEDAIAFHLPERPVPPSTIVIARHAHTGEPLQGRFYRD